MRSILNHMYNFKILNNILYLYVLNYINDLKVSFFEKETLITVENIITEDKRILLYLFCFRTIIFN